MKKILKSLLLGLIPIICLAIFFFFIAVLALAVKEAGGGDGAMVLMIAGVIWICASMAFYKTEDKI